LVWEAERNTGFPARWVKMLMSGENTVKGINSYVDQKTDARAI
jgi:hypothetical protein